jgi:hypothetical protein
VLEARTTNGIIALTLASSAIYSVSGKNRQVSQVAAKIRMNPDTALKIYDILQSMLAERLKGADRATIN